MRTLPKRYLGTAHRKRMWKNVKPLLEKIEKAAGLSEIYAIGSMISRKKNPDDIDFAIVARAALGSGGRASAKKCGKSKSSRDSGSAGSRNLSYPVDFIILPDDEDVEEYLFFFSKYMKKRYGKSFGPVRLK